MISPDEGDTTTTMIKSGFKGKRTNKKFGRYGKRGGDRKRNYTPSDNPTNDNTEQHRQQEIFPTNTGRKVTKKLIIYRLSQQYLSGSTAAKPSDIIGESFAHQETIEIEGSCGGITCMLEGRSSGNAQH
jgi:hypothetical protein